MIVRLVRVGKNAIRIFVENGTHSLPYQVNHQLSYNVLKAFHFSWRKTIKQIQHAKAVAGDKGITDTEILKKLLAKGKALYNILFPNGIEFLEKQVIFYTDPTIPDLPYEAIAYKGEVLVQNYSIIRQVEIPKRPKINQTSYRESLILTNPNDAADIKDLCNKEKEDLIKLLPNPIHLGKYSEISVVLEKLLQVKYFHYCGHIVKNKIFFQNSVLTPADIESMNLSHLNVVFLNACNSAQHQESSSSFANAFITAGVQNYIGYSIPASEQAARFIAQSFWKKVKKGISLEQAILQIRKEIISHFGIGELSWLGLNAFITFPHQKTLYQKIFSKVKKSMLMLFFPLLFFLLFIPYSQMQNKIEKQTSERKTHKKVGVRTSKQLKKHISRKPKQVLASHLQESEKVDVILSNKTQELDKKQTYKPMLDTSNELQSLVKEFMQTNHPIYTKEDKQALVKTILSSSINTQEKIKILRRELP